MQRVGPTDQLKVYDPDRDIVARSSQTLELGGGFADVGEYAGRAVRPELGPGLPGAVRAQDRRRVVLTVRGIGRRARSARTMVAMSQSTEPHEQSGIATDDVDVDHEAEVGPTVQARHFGLAVVALAVGGFTIGTTEFVTMGVLPQIADGVDVSIPVAGRVISAYALGVVIGAPCWPTSAPSCRAGSC